MVNPRLAGRLQDRPRPSSEWPSSVFSLSDSGSGSLRTTHPWQGKQPLRWSLSSSATLLLRSWPQSVDCTRKPTEPQPRRGTAQRLRRRRMTRPTPRWSACWRKPRRMASSRGQLRRIGFGSISTDIHARFAGLAARASTSAPPLLPLSKGRRGRPCRSLTFQRACVAKMGRVRPGDEPWVIVQKRWQILAENRDRQADDCAAWGRDMQTRNGAR